ncbi:MAG: bifunctional acetate--CoA ligase family protein/GNAT family N-acetyltransferase [Usitatibacter sp.]
MAGHYLARLFEPRSVALIGASERPGKVGTVVFANLLDGGYAGAIHAVNPKYSAVRGVPCVARVSMLPAGVDLAVIATPPATVPGLIEDCGAAGITAAVVITAGFGELGPAGKELERAVLEKARLHGVRMLGPNCLGLARPSLGLNATFARGQALRGSLALVAQSGAVCSAMLDWATPSGIGFSSVISMGGSTDVDFGEVIDYLASDEKTNHILLYVEGVRDGRRLVGSLRAAARMKPVIVMKVGRYPAGSRAAVSHTGAMVGRDDVFDAVVRRTGIVRVATAGQLVAAALALDSQVSPRGNRLAVVTNGGGPGVMAADRASELGIALPELAPETLQRLQEALPASWSHGNPVDLIGDADAARYRTALATCLADPSVDGVVAILTPQAMTDASDAAQAVIAAAKGSSKPIIACWMGEASVAEGRRLLRAAGLPVFRLPEMAVEAFACLADFNRNQRALLEAPPPLAHSEPPDLARARQMIAAAIAEGRSILGATESKELLAAFRIPVLRSVDVANAAEAVFAANAAGYPVVMKIRSPDITHKSDVGGVHLGIPDAIAVREAFEAMMAEVKRRRPEARIDGVSIEPMLNRPYARELMAGIARDPVFGPAIMFGAGGIAIEVLRDRVVALPPLNATLVEDMIHGTKVSRMLDRFRNLPPVDRAALDAVLLRVSEMATELPELVELDINPLVADERGALALDARIVVRAAPPGLPRYGHLAIHPYPQELEGEARLRDGTAVLLRPIRPEDAPLEEAFIATLSPDTMRLRFLSAMRSLTPAMLARFTQIDYDREMAFVALVGEGEDTREIGVGRYATLPDGRTCEYAIVLADAWHGRGLGEIMMRRLVEVARARGLETMVGDVLASNDPMLRLCAKLGFASAAMPDDPGMRRVTLDLRGNQR